MLKPGGKLLYSTCTFSKLEDEDSVIHLLTNRPDMHLIDIKPYEGFSHGFDTDEGYHLEKAVRIFLIRCLEKDILWHYLRKMVKIIHLLKTCIRKDKAS